MEAHLVDRKKSPAKNQVEVNGQFPRDFGEIGNSF